MKANKVFDDMQEIQASYEAHLNTFSELAKFLHPKISDVVKTSEKTILENTAQLEKLLEKLDCLDISVTDLEMKDSLKAMRKNHIKSTQCVLEHFDALKKHMTGTSTLLEFLSRAKNSSVQYN